MPFRYQALDNITSTRSRRPFNNEGDTARVIVSRYGVGANPALVLSCIHEGVVQTTFLESVRTNEKETGFGSDGAARRFRRPCPFLWASYRVGLRGPSLYIYRHAEVERGFDG